MLTLTGFGSLAVIVGMLLLGNAFLGLVVPTTMVMALDPHPDIAGLASSLGGTLQMLTGGAIRLSTHDTSHGAGQTRPVISGKLLVLNSRSNASCHRPR